LTQTDSAATAISPLVSATNLGAAKTRTEINFTKVAGENWFRCTIHSNQPKRSLRGDGEIYGDAGLGLDRLAGL